MSVDKTLKTQLNDYQIDEVAPKIYKINEYNLSTMFVIVGEKRALAIDTGTGVGDYKAVIEKLTGGLPYDVVLSHGHVDHAGGRGQFDRIYIGRKDLGIVKEATAGYRKFYILIMRYLMGFRCITLKKANIRKVVREPELIPVDEGKIFDLGGRTIEIYETPGHTEGCLCFLLKEDKILFSGDTFNPLMLMFLAHATTIEEYRRSTGKILAVDGYDYLWPSHLSAPLTIEDATGIQAVADKILRAKHNFLLPSVFIKSLAKRSIIYRPDRIRLKRKKKAEQDV